MPKAALNTRQGRRGQQALLNTKAELENDLKKWKMDCIQPKCEKKVKV